MCVYECGRLPPHAPVSPERQRVIRRCRGGGRGRVVRTILLSVRAFPAVQETLSQSHVGEPETGTVQCSIGPCVCMSSTGLDRVCVICSTLSSFGQFRVCNIPMSGGTRSMLLISCRLTWNRYSTVQYPEFVCC